MCHEFVFCIWGAEPGVPPEILMRCQLEFMKPSKTN